MLAVALLPVVAAPLAGEPGTTHAAWHVAAVLLQLIMQLVVLELCARRTGLLLFVTAPAGTAAATDSKTQTPIAKRTPASSRSDPKPGYRVRRTPPKAIMGGAWAPDQSSRALVYAVKM